MDLVEARKKLSGLQVELASRRQVLNNQEDLNALSNLTFEMDKLDAEIRAEELEQRVKANTVTSTLPGTEVIGGDPATEAADKSGVLHNAAFGNFVAHGHFPSNDWIVSNDMQSDSLVDGGYFVAPQEMVNTIIKTLDDEVYIRKMSRQFTIGRGQSLGVLVRRTKAAQPSWTSEIGEIDRTTTPTYGKREFKPTMSAQEVVISMRLLDSPGIDASGQLMLELGIANRENQEFYLLNGNGNQQPLGWMFPSDDGIPLSQDYAAGSATAPTADGLISAMYQLKEPYWRNSVWMFHRLIVMQIRLLKDNENRYLWQPSIQAGQPGTVLGSDFVMSEWMPSEAVSGGYFGLWGDFSTYWVVTSMGMTIQRLNELYAKTSEIGFISRWELDGQPTQAEAMIRLKYA